VKGPMHKLQQFSEFESYARARKHEIERSMFAIERRGLKERSKDVVCSQTGSVAISAKRSSGFLTINATTYGANT
jgi:hypothetical protein